MEIDNGIVHKLQNIIDRLKLVEGNNRGRSLEYASPVTEEALCEVENRLGVILPPSFRKVLKTIGKSLYFYYSLNDFILPTEFSEIFSGGLSWDLEALEFVNEITGECISEDDDEEEAYAVYDKKDILRIIQDKIMEQNQDDTQRLLITMAAELVGGDAGPWAKELWESITEYPKASSTSLKMGKYSFSSDLLAYLSAYCMEKEQAFYLVTDYLLQWAGGRLTGWDILFMSVRPRWTDLLEWSKGANKKVLIDGLADYVEGKEGFLGPEELPGKPVVLDWLAELKEAEILNIRKRKIDKIIEGIDLLCQ